MPFTIVYGADKIVKMLVSRQDKFELFETDSLERSTKLGSVNIFPLGLLIAVAMYVNRKCRIDL